MALGTGNQALALDSTLELVHTDIMAILAAIIALPAPGDATAANQVLQIAEETGINGHVHSIDGKTPALGQALAAASVPVVLPAAQETALTPPTAAAVAAAIAALGALPLPTGASTAALQGQPIAYQKRVAGLLHVVSYEKTALAASGTSSIHMVATNHTLTVHDIKCSADGPIKVYIYSARTISSGGGALTWYNLQRETAADIDCVAKSDATLNADGNVIATIYSTAMDSGNPAIPSLSVAATKQFAVVITNLSASASINCAITVVASEQ